MKYTGTLEALYSRRDRNGNTYWALRYTCHASGRSVHGTISGGESNIFCASQYLDAPEYGRTLQRTQDFPIREFNRLTKGWEYAGCEPREIAAWIRKKLSETV